MARATSASPGPGLPKVGLLVRIALDALTVTTPLVTLAYTAPLVAVLFCVATLSSRGW